MLNLVATARRASAGFIAALTLTACEKTQSTEPLLDHQHHLSVDVAAASPVAGAGKSLIKAVHSASARFHSTKQALKSGYVADPFCVEHPALGGMGHHWANQALVDPVFEATSPEVMLYAPDKNGKLKLVAVEYIVINTGQPAPTFDGQRFDVGGSPIPVAHWTLHVWLHQPNPAGIFAPFNPDVNCP